MNFYKAVLSGFTPITVCSDLLRVGGYTRAVYYLKTLEEEFEKNGVSSIEEYIKKIGNSNNIYTAISNNLNRFIEEALEDERYKYEKNSSLPKRINSHLWEFDCITCDKCIPVCPN
ncbi:MAG: hypothetical protein NZ870_04685, partial [bacterium]|nr:hypothetical protein [bacterium]